MIVKVASLVLAASSIQATPQGLRSRDNAPGNTFSVNQVANPGYNGYVATGQSALVKAYAKYGKQLPASIKSAATKVAAIFQNQGSVATQPEVYDSEYLCSVAIGTPPQSLFLDFDTGSADLWVFSTETNTTQVNRQTLYNPSTSKTSSSLAGSTWSIVYGDGSSSTGDVWLDSVNVGGVVVPHQAVENARQVSATFTQDSASSGLLGLGFSKLNTVRPNTQQTFFDNVKGLLKAGVIGVDLKAGAFGTYDFGFIDGAKKSGDVTYTPLNSTQGFWGIEASGYAIGNSTTTTKAPTPGIVDTGTTLLLLPDALVEDYYAGVPNSTYSVSEAGWIFDCNEVSPPPPPDFSLVINGYRARVPGSYLNYAPSQTRDGYCFGGIQSSAELGVNIFGDVFLKSQFVVLDGEEGRVGFAAKRLG
ncbi:hypothetical protein M409DRAFT_37926 [Zasmidium cellare ATCC 36951]|uniref:Peptidase A1 domain-containing protein n=1 Tax=Zasmidium cellare ATCC 36951 TaxID=1080233 RepID=A0A6A6BXK6_ZASCE|nr:uncharacterized protein M409DRAFT_37926 [Zasmidium cellare ATCC 36951]KAF2159425.1 hypothetical protein M409DRAFT_37926 [Zasmidium cellare ATCC 36951]